MNAFSSPSPELLALGRQFPTLGDLAQAYAPFVCRRQARRRLNIALKANPLLMEHLASVGFIFGQRTIFPIHAAVIMMHMGVPNGL